MKLNYRGVSYEYNPVQTGDNEVKAPATDLKYRGATYRTTQAARERNLNAVLTYRGATYQIQSGSKVESTPAPAAVLTYRGMNYQVNPQRVAEVAPVVTIASGETQPVDLKYRGTAYRLGQAAKAENLNAVLKYRGAAYQQTNVEATPANAVLKYRGVAYNLHPAAEVAPEPVATPVATPSIDDRLRMLNMQHQRFIKNRQQTMLSRLAVEVGVDSINNYWNRIQGKIHPSFRTSYDRSHVALS